MSSNKLPHRIFVYGTLKNGQPNHHHMENRDNGTAKFVAHGLTDCSYPLIIGTRWNLPFLLYSPGSGQRIQGEIYDVDDKFLNWADKFEDHPEVYLRRQVKVLPLSAENDTTEDSEPRTDCWIYFVTNFLPELLQKPTYSSYNAYGEHNLIYRPEEDTCSPSNIDEAFHEDISIHNSNPIPA
jgi:gamma-glutamylaminecyclotransferase